MSRLRSRLAGRGMTGDISDERIRRIIDILNLWPKTLQAQVEREMSGKFSIFDVSLVDWGAERLKIWVQNAV